MPIPFKTLKNGTILPALGLGTWLMGGDTQKIISPQDAIDISTIKLSIDNGCQHIDTAESYGAGHAEELVGEAIRGYDRSKLFIASKAYKGHHTRTLLAEALDDSLQRLRTDYVDLYYLHQPTLETPFEETAEALNKALASGKIKNIGVCNFSKTNFDKLQKFLDTPILANQVHYNLSFREPEVAGLIEHSIANDYFIIAWRPIRLKRRNQENTAVAHDIWDKGAFPLLDQMAEKYNKTNVQIALAWTTHLPNVCTLVKSSNTSHLNEAIDSFDFKLSKEDYISLRNNFAPQYSVSDTVPLI